MIPKHLPHLSKIYAHELLITSSITLFFRMLAVAVYSNHVAGTFHLADLYHVIIFPFQSSSDNSFINGLSLLIHLVFSLPSVLMASLMFEMHADNILQQYMIRGQHFAKMIFLSIFPAMLFCLITESLTAVIFLLAWGINGLDALIYLMLASLSKMIVLFISDWIHRMSGWGRTPACLIVFVISYLCYAFKLPHFILSINPFQPLALLGNGNLKFNNLLPSMALLSILIVINYIQSISSDYLGGAK